MSDATLFFSELVRLNPDDLLDQLRSYLSQHYGQVGPLSRALPDERYPEGGPLLKPLLSFIEYTLAMQDRMQEFTLLDYRVYRELVERTFPDYEWRTLDLRGMDGEERLQFYELVPTSITSTKRYTGRQQFMVAASRLYEDTQGYDIFREENLPLIQHCIHERDWPRLIEVVFDRRGSKSIFDEIYHADLLPYVSLKWWTESRRFTTTQLAVLNALAWLALRRYNFRDTNFQFKNLLLADFLSLMRDAFNGPNVYGSTQRHTTGTLGRFKGK